MCELRTPSHAAFSLHQKKNRDEGAILFIARVAAIHCVAEARSVPLWGAVPQFWMVASSIFLISGLI